MSLTEKVAGEEIVRRKGIADSASFATKVAASAWAIDLEAQIEAGGYAMVLHLQTQGMIER